VRATSVSPGGRRGGEEGGGETDLSIGREVGVKDLIKFQKLRDQIIIFKKSHSVTESVHCPGEGVRNALKIAK
jgi:hypothetical protein